MDATVNITGTLVNSDTVNGNVTRKPFADTSTTGHGTGNGTWNLSSGTIQGGTIVQQDLNGRQFLNTGYGQTGSFQNLTLGSNFNLSNNYFLLDILKGTGSGQANDLITSGQTISVSNVGMNLYFNEASNPATGAYIGQTLSNVTINLSLAPGATLSGPYTLFTSSAFPADRSTPFSRVTSARLRTTRVSLC